MHPGWKPLVEAGKLRLLMVWTDQRAPSFPDVPTLKELGYPLVIDSPWGLAGPKGQDPKIVARLHDAFKKATDTPSVIALLAKYDMVVNYRNTEDYRKFVAETIASETKAVEALGLGKKKIKARKSVHRDVAEDHARSCPGGEDLRSWIVRKRVEVCWAVPNCGAGSSALRSASS